MSFQNDQEKTEDLQFVDLEEAVKVGKEQIDTETPKKKKKLIYDIILAICIIIFIISGIKLFMIFSEYKKGVNEYDELASIAHEQVTGDDLDLNRLKSLNADLVGWIKFDQPENINYPVVRGEDNDYYLSHTFNKEENTSASIFMDFRCSRDFSDRNTIIYGHNMKNKSMFGNLDKYKEKAFYTENPGFYIYDFTGKHYYEIFAAYTIAADGDCYNTFFANDEDFAAYLNRAKEYSDYPIDVTLTGSDKIVTLSTCTTSDEYRYVIQAVRRDGK